MTLARTDEQVQFAEALRRFLEAENPFERHRQRLAAAAPQRMALWQGLADLGALGAMFDEASGGFAGDARTLALAMSEVGRALLVEPFAACAVVAGHIIASQTRSEEVSGQIERIIAGEHVTVLAHDAGVDPFAMPMLTVRAADAGFILNGVVRCVRHADVADEFLVTAAMDSEVLIFKVPRSSLDITAYRLMDGAAAADVRLAELLLPADTRLTFESAGIKVLHAALERGCLALAAETAGIVAAANQGTFRYLGERKQFGVPLATFQALQHRAADMQIAALELNALLELAIDSLDTPGAHCGPIVAALKVAADATGRRVGHESVQLHGGMGVSDELIISHYARRLATMRAEFGIAEVHRLRFGTATALSEYLSVQDSPQDREWREFVRGFTRKHLPASIARKGRLSLKIDKQDYVDWQKILRQHALFAGAWPKEYGGSDWDLLHQLLFVQESSIGDAPMISPYGVNMVGPVLYTYGTEMQKQQHLPGILSSDVWWCQGYSEPGAGSDLASLKTSARLEGDHYIVNGAKLWTTEAHWADWMHCLVRTDTGGRPQAGITFLLIDMRSPGISQKPIVTIDGLHHTNALFFDNVRVPVANRVGSEGMGWTIAKFLLSRERVSIADTGPKLRLLAHVRELFDAALAEPCLPAAIRESFTATFTDLRMQLLTLCTMERQYIAAWAAGAEVGPAGSVLKIRGTEILQALCEFALEVEGPMGAAHDPEDAHRSPDEALTSWQRASLIGYEYLYSRCWSIFGGTNEIQRNIIAKYALG